MDGLKVLDVAEKTYTFDMNSLSVKNRFGEAIGKSVSKVSSAEKTSVKVYTISFEKGGKRGYAIMSGDERTCKVYAYAPYGELSDTANIVGLKEIIDNIENTCRQDLVNYLAREETKSLMSATSL